MIVYVPILPVLFYVIYDKFEYSARLCDVNPTRNSVCNCWGKLLCMWLEVCIHLLLLLYCVVDTG